MTDDTNALSSAFANVRDGILTFVNELLRDASIKGIIDDDQAQAIYELAESQ